MFRSYTFILSVSATLCHVHLSVCVHLFCNHWNKSLFTVASFEIFFFSLSSCPSAQIKHLKWCVYWLLNRLTPVCTGVKVHTSFFLCICADTDEWIRMNCFKKWLLSGKWAVGDKMTNNETPQTQSTDVCPLQLRLILVASSASHVKTLQITMSVTAGHRMFTVQKVYQLSLCFNVSIFGTSTPFLCVVWKY